MTNTVSELEIIRTFWPIVYAISTAALAFVVWLIRLEGKQKSNHEKIVQVEKMQETEGHRMAKAIETMSDTQSKMAESLSDMRATLSGIVGYERGKEEADSGSAGLDNGETLTCTNAGKITIYPVITVEPTELNQNFVIFNDTTDDVFTFSSSTFAPGTSLEIDCQNGTVYLTNGSTVTEVSNGIADGTGFLHLVPGANALRYVSAFGPVTMTVSFRRRWPF